MRSSSLLMSTALSLLVAIAAAGCVIEDGSSSSRRGPSTTGTGAPSATNTTPPPSSTAPPPSTPPVRLVIDTGRTLTAQPGVGAGIFVTYQGDGHWQLQWTCDTKASGNTCDFDVSVAADRIQNYSAVPGGTTVALDAHSFRVQSTTGSTLDGAQFDTAPGASIVVSESINGTPTPTLMFYVANGKLATAPTDPVEFVPSAR